MNNKKITIIFIVVACLVLVGIGLTMAYFTSSTDFENEFNTALYQTEATETFTSPQNWMPGDETPKTLTITNTGNVDVKARVCIEENWESDNGDTLPNEQNGERVAILNLDNTSDWTKKGNCYEYNDTLEPNDTTSSFIESVTFNPNVDLDITCTTSTSGNSTTKTCGSTGDGYDNATYTLTLTVETIQASAYDALWNNSFVFVNRQNAGQITVGDEVALSTEHFYVVSSNQNTTLLLSKYNLLVGNIYDFDNNASHKYSFNKTLTSNDEGYGLQSNTAMGWYDDGNQLRLIVGSVPFSGTNYWHDNSNGIVSQYAVNGASYNGNPYPYVYNSSINTVAESLTYTYGSGIADDNGYSIAYYVENYKSKLETLGAPLTITGRLLSIEEAQTLGCDISLTYHTCKNSPGHAPAWVYSSSYWLGSAGHSIYAKRVLSDGDIHNYYFNQSDYYGVRPVIEIPTSELN